MKHITLAGAAVIVTGASSGIGEAAAREFAKQGSSVVLAARRLDRLEELAKQLQASGVKALPIQADLSKRSDMDAVVSQTLKEFGKIDVLFNNAGFGRLDFLDKLDAEKDIVPQVQVNLLGVIQMTQAVLPHMMRARAGHIINMSSIAGWVATPTYSVYAASKFAIRGFSESLRREVMPWGITVSTIYPYSVATEFGDHAGINRKTRSMFSGRLVLTADSVASEVVRTVEHPKPDVILPKFASIAIQFCRAYPRIVDWLMVRRFTIPERKAELAKQK